MDLSLVVPVYNEADNLRPLCQRIHEVLAPTGWTYELVIVDDGSTDESAKLLACLHAEDPRLKVLRFRRNFGQTAALAAGLAYAHGEVIVSLDGRRARPPPPSPGRPWSPAARWPTGPTSPLPDTCGRAPLADAGASAGARARALVISMVLVSLRLFPLTRGAAAS